MFAGLVAVAVVLLAWEWNRLCLQQFGPAGVVLGITGVATAVLGESQPLIGLAVIPMAAIVAPLSQRLNGRSLLWMAAGAIYIGMPALSLVWMRHLGRGTLFWLLLLVWATDIGAYAAGRIIGGPKLLPKVSPKKTWAGLGGGILSAAVVGGAVALANDGGPEPVSLAFISGGLAIVAQAGDLAESWVKRHFGVKDSSCIIPGHGGVMDRLDGLLATAPVVAVLCLAFGGGLSQWR
jgi:phosphatidate cytidylyltransferase